MLWESQGDIRLVRRNVKQDVLSRWQKRWTEGITGRQTFSFLPNIEVRLRMKILPGHEVTQFLTGHGDFNQYLCRFGLKDACECTACGGLEDANHVLWSCPRWERERVPI